MRLRAAPGEIALGLIFAAAGAFWIVSSLRMPLWEGTAPASGFLPLIYGGLLVALALAALAVEATSAEQTEAERGPLGKPAMVIGALAAGIAGIEPAGFAAAMFLAMLFLFRIAEKLPLLPSLAASAGSALVLTLVFRTWLGVPLPKGPWGF
ncbi:MAG: tripartite tricarboxylate transporter TctB family protein [Beijerinckiaceae bacterium]